MRTKTAAGLKERAEVLLHELGQSDMYANCVGGVVGFLIKQDNPPWTNLQIEAGMRGLGIPSTYVPETAILRDALPHLVHLKRLLLPLTSGYVQRREELLVILGGLAKELETPDAALQIPLVKLREMARGLTAG